MASSGTWSDPSPGRWSTIGRGRPRRRVDGEPFSRREIRAQAGRTAPAEGLFLVEVTVLTPTRAGRRGRMVQSPFSTKEPESMSLEQLLASIPPGSPDEALARQVNFEQLPAHVAIIMDGNGRWAARRHLPRVEGHRAGIDSVRDVVETSARLGIEVLTLYAFSVENWKRPRAEVSTLMLLLKRYIRSELGTLNRNNIRFKVIGRPEALAPDVQRELEIGIERTAGNTGMLFNIALNYGGRTEIVDAVRRAIVVGHGPGGSRRTHVLELSLHGRSTRSRSAHSDQRRNARQQFSAVADRLRGNLGDRDAVARLPAPRSAERGPGLPEARSPLRRHQAVAGGPRRQVSRHADRVGARR